MATIRDIAIDFLGRGGKRLRPRLCRAACRAAGGDADAPAFAKLLEAVECFHKASLIHDDIQDGDEARYGRPTVWKEHGVAAAIAAGDWLVAYGYGLIAESGYPNAAGMLRVTTRSHLLLCEGQGDELAGALPHGPADAAAYVSVISRKTGEAFALAAELGALAAGADPADYRAFGLAFGILFQIRDDIADVGASDALARLNAEYGARLASSPLYAALGGFATERL